MRSGAGKRVAWGLALGLTVAGCSLEGLASYDVAHCDSTHLTCEGLNTRDGLPETACVRWNCGPTNGACVLGPRDLDGDGDPDPACSASGHDCDDHMAARHSGFAEACDGIDNDCNGVIDDGLDPAMFVRSSTISGIAADAAHGGYAPSTDVTHETLVLVHGTALARDASLLRLSDVAPTPASVTHATSDATMGLGHSTFRPEDVCPGDDGTSSAQVVEPCDEADFAVDSLSDGSLLAAAVSDLPDACRHAGVLRVGRIDAMDAVMRHQGPQAIANTFPTLDTPPLCTTGAASRPVVALSSDAHALVAYLRAPIDSAPACFDGVDFEVALAGVWLSQAVPSHGVQVPVLNASAIAALGHAGTYEPPAIVALPGERGWLIAYGATDGTIALSYAGPLAASPAPLVTTSLGSLPTSAHSVGHLAVSAGRATAGSVEAAIAWIGARDPMGACAAEAEAALVRIVIDLGAGPTMRALGDAVSLGTPSAVSVTHVDRGMLAAYDGMAESGGYVVVTVDGGTAQAYRVSDERGAPIDAHPIALGTASRLPHALPDGAQVAFTYVRDPDLVRGTLGCMPRAMP